MTTEYDVILVRFNGEIIGKIAARVPTIERAEEIALDAIARDVHLHSENKTLLGYVTLIESRIGPTVCDKCNGTGDTGYDSDSCSACLGLGVIL